MKPDFLNTLLKEPDAFWKYKKFLINNRGRKLPQYWEMLPQYGEEKI